MRFQEKTLIFQTLVLSNLSNINLLIEAILGQAFIKKNIMNKLRVCNITIQGLIKLINATRICKLTNNKYKIAG